jgi:hypothetical protein
MVSAYSSSELISGRLSRAPSFSARRGSVELSPPFGTIASLMCGTRWPDGLLFLHHPQHHSDVGD